MKTMATYATEDIMKDEEYVKKLSTEILDNEHILTDLNISVTRYVQVETSKAVDVLPISV